MAGPNYPTLHTGRYFRLAFTWFRSAMLVRSSLSPGNALHPTPATTIDAINNILLFPSTHSADLRKWPP